MIMLNSIVEGIEAALQYQLTLDYEHMLPGMKYDYPNKSAEWYKTVAKRISFQSNQKIWELSFALLQAYALLPSVLAKPTSAHSVSAYRTYSD